MLNKGRFIPGIALLIFSIFLSACAPSETESLSGPKVIVFVWDGSYHGYHLDDVEIMVSMLEEAGIQAVIATESEDSYQGSDPSMMSDILMLDGNAADYDGFLLPCGSPIAPSDAVAEVVSAMVVEAADQNKPIAAHHGAVNALAEGGILDGVHYAYKSNDFPEGIYEGTWVVRDGNIITSGCCGSTRSGECAAELTQHLIEAVAP
jgi:hypothetical protein